MKNNHTTIRNKKLFCENCGGEFTLPFPIDISSMSQQIKSFNKLHKDCEKTWSEPSVNPNDRELERASWWIKNGETGLSSITIWNCMMGNTNFSVHHPYDPDDFKRCYKLLEVMPEWKNQLNKLERLSVSWGNLVKNWNKLTEMYELNQKSKWKNHQEIGMYEFMQTIINNN